jgi:hypothetical protein
MGIDERVLRSELVKQPRPAKIIVTTEDDEQQEVRGAGKSGVTWAAVSRTILALNPKMVSLFDESGALLRAVNADSGTVETPGPSAASIPASIAHLHTDPETARLVHFANLLADAYKFATGVAFTKIAELSQHATDRMVALEGRLERAESNYRREMQERIEDAFDEADAIRDAAKRGDAEGAQSILDELIKGFMNGASDAKGEKQGAKS